MENVDDRQEPGKSSDVSFVVRVANREIKQSITDAAKRHNMSLSEYVVHIHNLYGSADVDTISTDELADRTDIPRHILEEMHKAGISQGSIQPTAEQYQLSVKHAKSISVFDNGVKWFPTYRDRLPYWTTRSLHQSKNIQQY